MSEHRCVTEEISIKHRHTGGSRVFPLFGYVKAVFADGISFKAYYCHIDCDSGTIFMMKVQPDTVLSTVR